MLVSAAVILASLAVTLVSFLSRLEATPQEPLVESYDFSTPFVVRNTGIFPLYDVEFSCMHHFVAASPLLLKNTMETAIQTPVSEFWPSDAHTIQCHIPDAMFLGRPAGPLTMADVSLVVHFKNVFWVNREKQLRFIGTRDSDGTLRWLPRASDAPAIYHLSGPRIVNEQ